jgi:hypothetical protein
MSTRKITDLHDARLTGINYLQDSKIQLEFTKVDLSKASIWLNGVVSFFCTGMLEGNIVLSVEIFDAEDISLDDMAYFVEMEARGQQVSHLQMAIRDKGLCMLQLVPSYGAELACVCSAVTEQ